MFKKLQFQLDASPMYHGWDMTRLAVLLLLPYTHYYRWWEGAKGLHSPYSTGDTRCQEDESPHGVG